MTSEKPTEILATRGQAKSILARIRPALREHVRPHTRDQQGEQLGGDSVLNARWRHRLSRDLDVHLQLDTIEDAREVLDRAAAAAGGYRIEHPRFRRIEFERNRDNHVDVSFSTPEPARGEESAIVDGEKTIVLSTAQIMTGKLSGRGMMAPTRDLVDIAVCGIADPEALEIAVNGLDEERLNAILNIYAAMKAAYMEGDSPIEEVPDSLQPIVADPTAYATNAILAAKYERFAIRTTEGAARIETTTTNGARIRSYMTGETLRDGMEQTGVNAFLAAQQRNENRVLNVTIDALLNRNDTAVLQITPAPLRHGRLSTQKLAWKPPKAPAMPRLDNSASPQESCRERTSRQ